MNRTLAPEWLDALPSANSHAVGSRRDLRRLNSFMRHPALVSAALRNSFPNRPPAGIAELGAGDGSFLLKTASLLASSFPSFPSMKCVLVDRRPSVSDATRRAFDRLGCRVEVIEADVFDWLQSSQADAAVANLFLHHFTDSELRRLFFLLSTKCNALVACEPRRALFPFVVSHLLGGIGCNAVTRHDAPISVRAGFRSSELTALWPDSAWRLRENGAGLFSHLFVARR